MARSFGYYKQEIYLFQEWLGGDKVTHIIMGFAILLALRLLLPKPPLFFLTFGVLIILAFSYAVWRERSSSSDK